MINILEAALKNNYIISFCVGKVNWDKRIIGYIKSLKGETIIIDVVDIYGSVIKKRNIAIKKISIVEINDSYNRHLEKLKSEGEIIKKTKSKYYYNKGTKFKEKLESLKSKGNICTIFFETEYLTGIIKNVSDNIIFIQNVGYRGTKEGESCCKLSGVTSIRYDGPLEKKISYLAVQERAYINTN
ncbi:MAG TPA: hypothetical protein VGO09_01805 [Flavisolibacter sp.]|jgi:hypothetical protein|nr:hypothetical protein [Flavisolibacter sp.]